MNNTQAPFDTVRHQMSQDIQQFLGKCNCDKNAPKGVVMTCDVCKPSKHDIDLINKVLDEVKREVEKEAYPDFEQGRSYRNSILTIVDQLKLKSYGQH